MSSSFTVVKLDQRMVPGLVDTMMDRYSAEECGICEQTGPKKYVWSSTKGLTVHERCFELVDPTQTTLVKTIDRLFVGGLESNAAHRAAVTAVRTICGEPIRSYLEKNGQDALTHLFDTVGVKAVETFDASDPSTFF